jgi:CubicO group peptidase (beta-lactamase class C family)
MTDPISCFLGRQKRFCRLLARLVYTLLMLALVSCGSGNSTHTLPPLSTLPLSSPVVNSTQPTLAQLGQAERAHDSQIAAHVDALFDNLVGQSAFSGSVLIARAGRVLLDKGYSMANWQTNTPNTPQTRFYLGSVTKEFTAMAILILQARGKLDVRKSVCTYVKPCPPSWQPVTVHNLLTHTSGIPELDTSQLSGTSPAAWIASFDDVDLDFTPGDQFSYCSVCYQILAYVVEQVGGVPYDQFVQKNILTPLQMAETGFDSDFYYAQSNAANGYDGWQSDAEQLGYSGLDPSWSFLSGSGLLYSTVNDLYRWDQALYTTALVPQKILDEAFTSYTQSSLFAGSTYGYGWFIAKSPIAGHRLIWHDGVIDGFRTYIGRYIDDHVTVIFLSNLSSVDSPTLAQQVQNLVFAQ